MCVCGVGKVAKCYLCTGEKKKIENLSSTAFWCAPWVHTSLQTALTHPTHIPMPHTYNIHVPQTHMCICVPPNSVAHHTCPAHTQPQLWRTSHRLFQVSHCFRPQLTSPSVRAPPTVLLPAFHPDLLPVMPPSPSAIQNKAALSGSCPWFIPFHPCQVPITSWLFYASKRNNLHLHPAWVCTCLNIFKRQHIEEDEEVGSGSNPVAPSSTVRSTMVHGFLCLWARDSYH